MIVDLNGEFVTARSHPKLVQVRPDVQFDTLILTAPGMMKLSVDTKRLLEMEPIKVLIWGQSIDAVDVGEEAARWFSRYLLQEDFGFRLMFYPSDRPTREIQKKKNKIFQKDSGAYHDAISFMMINESSILELNSRVKAPVSAFQFRPNFVVKGAPAFAEDNWQWVKVGDDAIFRNVKPCTR